MAAPEPQKGHNPISEYRIIDCDSHLTEPPDLWTSRVPRHMRHRVPVLRTVEGTSHWFLADEPWATIGGHAIARGRVKQCGVATSIQPFDAIDPSAWRVKDRLALLDDEGIFAQILYPNGIGFASNHIFAVADETDRAMILQIYNDFLVDVQSEAAGRLFPQAMLPCWDIRFTVREMERLLDRGMRGFTLSDKPELLGLPELIDPYFDPMWAIFNESGAVANFHVGAGRSRAETQALYKRIGFNTGEADDKRPVSISGGDTTVGPAWRSLPKQRMVAVGIPQARMSNLRIVANLCLSDLFDRFPNLRIASVESAIGWVPFVLECLEYQFSELITCDEDLSYASRRPTEYFRDHFTVGCSFERAAPAKLVEEIGAENIVVESDIPHPTCLFPGMRDHFHETLNDLASDVQRKILQDNASGRYRITLPKDSNSA